MSNRETYPRQVTGMREEQILRVFPHEHLVKSQDVEYAQRSMRSQRAASSLALGQLKVARESSFCVHVSTLAGPAQCWPSFQEINIQTSGVKREMSEWSNSSPPPSFCVPQSAVGLTFTLVLLWSQGGSDSVTEQKALGLQELCLGLVIVFGGNLGHSVGKCEYASKWARHKPGDCLSGVQSVQYLLCPEGALSISELSKLRHKVNPGLKCELLFLRDKAFVISMDHAASQSPDCPFLVVIQAVYKK